MSEPTNQTMDWSPGAREAHSRQRFIGAWVQALGGGKPPDIDEILAAFSDPPSVDFRRDLESIDSLFRQRLAGGDGNAPADPGATINFDGGGPTVNDAARSKTAETVGSDSGVQFDPQRAASETHGEPDAGDQASNGNGTTSVGTLSEVGKE